MTRRTATSPARHISAQEAAGLVRSGMWLDFCGCLVQPQAFDAALAPRIPELNDVRLRSCLTLRPIASLEADQTGDRIHNYCWHFSGYDRAKHDAGRCTYVPLNLGEVPDYYRRFVDPVDILVLKVAPKDKNGVYNTGPTSVWLRAIAEKARTVIVEVCPHMPYAHGVDHGLHESEVDYVIDGLDVALPELPKSSATDIDHKVAHHIANEMQDGDCIQIGIGTMPNAVCALLTESGIKDLGVHTEMLTDGIIDLYKAGRITGAHKQIDKGKIVYTFALGSQSMYDTIRNNLDFLCYPVDYTNLPHMIMRNDNMISINNTTQIDLQGQAASESDGHRHLTGTGGQLQFVRGAYASKNGKSFMLLSSTYAKKGQRKSRIVLNQTPGNIITTPRSDTMYVVTEYGITNLKGKSVEERARALISLAHPDFREGLERDAYENGLIPKHIRPTHRNAAE
jgi:acyl-CoA hydrolase